MKKIISLILLFCMLLSTLPAMAATETDDTLIIDLTSGQAEFSLESGETISTNDTISPKVFYLSTSATALDTGTCGGQNGSWIDYDSKLAINLPDSFMTNLDGMTDVEVTVRYYDGDAAYDDTYLGLKYNSNNTFSDVDNYSVSTDHLLYESAGFATLAKSGTWTEHTFVLERPEFRNTGSGKYMWNFILTLDEAFIPEDTDKDNKVLVSEVRVSYGEKRELFLNVDSDESGNIFFGTTPVKLNLNVINPKKTAFEPLTAGYVVKDRIKDTEMFRGEKTFEVPEAESHTVSLDFSDQELPFATYTIDVEIYDGDNLLATKQAEFSHVNAMSESDAASPVFNKSIFALNDHLTDHPTAMDEGVELESRAGTKYIRISMGFGGTTKYGVDGNPIIGEFLSFEESETGENILDYLKLAKEKGFKVLGIVGNDPYYEEALHPFRKWEEQDGELVCTNEEEFQAYIDHFSAFCAHAMSELGEYVECWEITNEYNLETLGRYGGGETWYQSNSNSVSEEGSMEDNLPYSPVDLRDITIACSKAMKAVNPDAVIVGGVIGGAGRLWDVWYERMFNDELMKHIDAVSVHLYPENLYYLEEYENTSVIAPGEKIKALIAQYGGDQEVWMTEYNYTSQKIYKERTETLQAQSLLKFLIRNQFDNYFDRIYTYRMEGSYYESHYRYMVASPDDPYDVITTELSAKVPYLATSFLNKLTASARPVSLVSATEDDINYIAKFHNDVLDTPVYAIFNYNDPKTFEERKREVTIDEPGRDLVAYDMLGNVIGEGTDSITVTASSDIVYVTQKQAFNTLSDTVTENVSVYGIAAPNSKVSAIVLREDAELDDMLTSAMTATYIDQLVTDGEGQYHFTFGVRHGSGTYTIYITDEAGTRQIYDVTYNDGKFGITYRFSQSGGAIWDFAGIKDGSLTADYEILNPEADQKITDYVVIGAAYKGDTLVKSAVSKPDKLTAEDKFKSGEITIEGLEKAKIDKVKFFLLNNLSQLTPLATSFELK